VKTIRALAVVGILGLSGCAGFTAGVKHAVTGVDDPPASQTLPGYNYGVLLGNVLVAASGYLARHYQDKVLPKKGELPQ